MFVYEQSVMNQLVMNLNLISVMELVFISKKLYTLWKYVS